MTLLPLILMVLAFVLLLVDAFVTNPPPRVKLLSLGLACFVLAVLIGGGTLAI
jgi:hypothetical protein